MSLAISLSPPSTDISVGLLSSLLGPKWWLLATGQAPAGAGSILANMFSILDIALLMYVSALLVYQATVGGMATAHEGTPLGRRYHSIWAPIRGPAAFAMLFPLPWAKGLALIQCIALLGVYWGVGVADDVWNGFVQEIPKMSGQIMPSQSSVRRENEFVEKLAVLTAVQSYVVNRENVPLVGTWAWRGNVNSGDWIDTVKLGKGGNAAAAKATNSVSSSITSKQFIAGMGTIEVPCSNSMNNQGTTASTGFWSGLGDDVTDAFNYAANAVSTVVPGASSLVNQAQDNSICVAEKGAVNNVMNAMRPIANQIVDQNAQSNAAPVQPSQIAAVVQAYATQQEALYNQLNKNQGTVLTAEIKNFATESESLGWASSSFYYWTLNNINTASQAYMKMLRPKVNMPNLQYIGMGTNNFIEPTLKTAFAVVNHYQSSNNYLDDAMVAATAGGPSGKSSWLGGKVLNVVSSLDSGNPLANMMSAGHSIIKAGELTAAGGGVMAGIANGIAIGAPVLGGAVGALVPVGGETGGTEIAGDAAGGAAGGWIAGKLASPAARMIADTADTLGKLMLPLGLGLVVEGAIIAYVIPAIPGAIMTIAIIGWLFLVMELMVAAPLWAAAHAYAEGEGFAPQQAMYGYGAVIGIVMRPVLLTFGFVFMFFLIFIVGHFVGGAMSIYMAGMNGFNLGIVGGVAVLAIILGTIWGAMKFLMGLITHLADLVPQWIGGRGQHLGEKEQAIQGAQSGSDKAKGVALGAYGVGRAVAGD
ncbi:DotA/TraY family protein, partial [Acidithiobacillus albertensis]|uniref:DotA/TraY family protein n=1 Tax=Acidithiobacillus albertensis TaxID=119978 RepID=UPI001C06E865